MTRVRVQRIESIRDPEGNLGKRIEFVEERDVPRFAIQPPTEEAKMVQDILRAVQQQMPVLNVQGQFSFPKIILFLTEYEYEELGIIFDVNQTYELELTNQSVRFRKTP